MGHFRVRPDDIKQSPQVQEKARVWINVLEWLDDSKLYIDGLTCVSPKLWAVNRGMYIPPEAVDVCRPIEESRARLADYLAFHDKHEDLPDPERLIQGEISYRYG